MKLEASNLGQIIGRALYGELEPRRLDTAPLVAARRCGDRRAQMRALCARVPAVNLGDVALELGLGRAHAATLLSQWVQAGFVRRHGKEGSYVYTLTRWA